MWSRSPMFFAMLLSFPCYAVAAGENVSMKIVAVRADESEVAIRCVREQWGGGSDDETTEITVVRAETGTGRATSLQEIAEYKGNSTTKSNAQQRQAAWAVVAKQLQQEGFAVQSNSKQDLVPLIAAKRIKLPIPHTVWVTEIPAGKNGPKATLMFSFVPYLIGRPGSDDSWNVEIEIRDVDNGPQLFTIGRIEGDSNEVSPPGSADSRFSVGVSPSKSFAFVERTLEGAQGRLTHDYFFLVTQRTGDGEWSGALVPVPCQF